VYAASSKSARGPGGHWEEFWRDKDGPAEIMGGAGQKAALDEFWRAYFAESAAAAPGLALDVACGAAPLAKMARVVPGAQSLRFVCADYAPAALAAARAELGDGVAVVACDTARLPFASGSFLAVVSQFGVEYAGAAGFAEIARMAARGVGLVVHLKGGVIDGECAENAKAVDLFLSTDVIARARTALSKSGRAGAEPHAKAEAKLAAAFGRADAALAAAVASAGRELAIRYGGDLRRLVDRRGAYALSDALMWLDGVEARLSAYRTRMSSMTKAAQTQADMERTARLFAGAGYDGVSFEPIFFGADARPGAWRFVARRESSVAPRRPTE
jgi:SAM-dependent methyltransferase